MSRKDWVIKSISIEAGDAQIIRDQGMGFNLSKFVRECLRRHAHHQEQMSMLHRQPGIQERLGVCLPRSMCPVCWPEGSPSEHNFAIFVGKDPQSLNESQLSIEGQINHAPIPYEGPEVGNMEWLRSTIDQKFSIEGISSRGNEKPDSRKKPRGFISKVLKKLGK